jgi:hypothetical protein
MWRDDVPDLDGLIPEHPSKEQAAASLQRLRETFQTFCFADTELMATSDGMRVDITKPPGMDESSFLVALMTAVCRPSLFLAPGVLVRAPAISGAGSGKGLLVRGISAIAFGRAPHAVTAGGRSEELEKRIAAELIGGGPCLFLDNLNGTDLNSELLASAITERPARVRLLGRSQMLPLNASAFVAVTGNGLTVSEDLARRFITISLDPRTENPESRKFSRDLAKDLAARRAELLGDALTIWRWGRRSNESIAEGRALGSFSEWCRWVRDPLLALGCKDPVERTIEAKEHDATRQTIAEIFQRWWEKHGSRPVSISQLDEAVKKVADPQNRGPNYQQAYLRKLVDTRIGGFVLSRQASVGRWGKASYALLPTGEAEGHRGDRGHRGGERPSPPYAPDASGVGLRALLAR